VTKYEKLTLLMSGAALFASFATPAVTYYFFDQETKQYNSRGRFILLNMHAETIDSAGVAKDLWAEVKNIGERPAEKLQFTVVFPKSSLGTSTVGFSPEIPTTVKRDGNVTFYDVERTIAPQETVAISIEGPVGSVYLYTKYGDSLLLYQRGSGNSESTF